MTADKCHEFHSIDLAILKRKNLLRDGYWSTLTWSRGGQKTGSISLGWLGAAVILQYRTQTNGEDWKDVREIVPLVETGTPFGGRRQWFQCLGCNQRCRILYGGAVFRCRKCHGLKYETQYEPAFARAASRALKIRERLGCKGGVSDLPPAKPKGMHWRTYDRLQANLMRHERGWAEGIAAKWRLFEDEPE